MIELGVGQGDLSDNNLFWNLQTKIANRQMNEERKKKKSNPNGTTISDRSVIDALVYAMLRFPDGLPTSNNASKQLNARQIVFNGLSLLMGDQALAKEVVDRYRNSLVVLVSPFDDSDAIDDKV